MLIMKNVFDMLRLDGKTAIVTGAKAGLGFDMAGALAEAGANIVITSRTLDKAEAAVQEMKTLYPGMNALALELDHNDFEQCEKAAAAVMAHFGAIDILVNNAGGGSGAHAGAFWEREPDDYIGIIQNNLIGVMNLTRAVCPYMIRQGHGKIINVGSIAGVVGRDRELYHKSGKNEQSAGYAAAKGGVIAVTRDLACALAPHNICVNSISPGGFYRGEPEAFVKLYSEITPLGRMGKVGEDLKGTALLLASDAGNYITGQNIAVDGGFSICK